MNHPVIPKRPEQILWLNDARGIYIPRDFAKSFLDRTKHVSGVSDENWRILDEGPDTEHYWDAWTEVCDRAIVTDNNGVEFFLYQDGDLWLIPKGMEWSEENDHWAWPEESDNEQA